MGASYDADFEEAMLSGGYESLIAVPPPGIGAWPWDKIIQFKDVVFEANNAFKQAKRSRQNKVRFNCQSRGGNAGTSENFCDVQR